MMQRDFIFNNFEKLKESEDSNEQDKILRAERRAQTMKLREEWLNGNA